MTPIDDESIHHGPMGGAISRVGGSFVSFAPELHPFQRGSRPPLAAATRGGHCDDLCFPCPADATCRSKDPLTHRCHGPPRRRRNTHTASHSVGGKSLQTPVILLCELLGKPMCIVMDEEGPRSRVGMGPGGSCMTPCGHRRARDTREAFHKWCAPQENLPMMRLVQAPILIPEPTSSLRSDWKPNCALISATA